MKAKTRFASKEVQVKEKKASVVTAKQQEKIKATPTAATTEETQARQVQSAPLGLAGDTSKKVKPVKVKGAPKERLESKKTTAPVETTVDQTASPTIAPTADTPTGTRTDSAPTTQNPNNAPTPVQPTSQTTLPSTTQPVPGSNTQGQPILQNPPQ